MVTCSEEVQSEKYEVRSIKSATQRHVDEGDICCIYFACLTFMEFLLRRDDRQGYGLKSTY